MGIHETCQNFILGNRVSGSMPKEIGNISTLTSLTMEFNQLSGDLPQELGNLLSIERLFLTSNNLSGELPVALAKLITLKDFRISDNHVTGNIPRYIQNWTKLEKLVIQASGLDGEIPSGIADLVNLTDLTISDLNGSEKPFPPLNNMKSIKTLILRSCNISGELLGSVTTLKVIDLSFNKLSGGIPGSYSSLTDVDYIYLTGNLLNGTVPEWMLRKGDNIDLLYNNFTDTSSGSCQQRSVNLFGSSMERNHSGIVSCLRSFQCPKRLYYSLHINSGGKVTKNGDITYEDDTDNGGPAKFFQSMTNWAYSNTGHFFDDGRPLESYVWTNASRLSMNNPELYMTARLSPVSLTYYGVCLGNGNYMVDLHFAEIMFTDDRRPGPSIKQTRLLL